MKFLAALVAAPLALAAPILEARAGAAETIPGKWIAVLKPASSPEFALSSVSDVLGGATPRHSYQIGSFRGYAIDASDDVITTLAELSDIAYIEPDYKLSISSLTTQSEAPWGLARLSSREPGTAEYTYDDSAGEGTYSYIIDTGIYVDHPEFEGRASFGASFVEGDDSETDGNGHGTHVAGTTGSVSYGVAKKTNLIAVKVLDAEGSGALSQIIAGIQWAVDNATSQGRIGKAVANMSLGGSRLVSQSINTAAAAAVEAGLFLAVAAGNDGLPAYLYSPASEPSVCTVGATEADDSRASFSNFGSLIDVFAPGVDIISTWNNGSTGVISGTSMAAPHITGLGAYLLGLEGEMEPEVLCERIQELSTADVVDSALSTNNLLAYNGNA